MARSRILFNANAVFVGPSPATGDHFSSGNSGVNQITQLHRVQSFNLDANVSHQDINQLGQLAAIGREIVTAPEVTTSISYYLTNMLNENRLGFVTNGTCSCISGFLSKTQDERNIFFLNVAEGSDAAGYAGSFDNRDVIAIGNAFMSNYTAEAAVGGIPTVTIDFAALNFDVLGSSSGQAIPAVDPQNGIPIVGKIFTLPDAVSGVAGQVTALRPGDITLDLGNSAIGIDLSDAKIQDFSLSVPLTRETLEKLGSKFGFSKELQFPLTTTLTVNAKVGDYRTGRFADLLCNDQDYNMTINLRAPSCSGANGDIKARYVIKGAKIDSESFSQAVNDSENFSITWSTQIGAAEQTDRGIFFSGSLI